MAQAKAKATLKELEERALEAIEDGDDLIYDTAAEVGQMVGNVKHMHWFKLAVMQALTENHGKYAHLYDEVVAAREPAARPSQSTSLSM